MSYVDKLIIGLCTVLVIIIGGWLLIVNNPVGAGEFFGEVWLGIKIVFFSALVCGLAYAFVRIKQANRFNVVRDGNGERTVRAIIQLESGRTQVVQLSPVAEVSPVDAFRARQAEIKMLHDMLKFGDVVDANTPEEEYEVAYIDEETGEEIDINAMKQLPAPKMRTLSEQLSNGGTEPNEETSIVGYVEGEALRGRLFAADGNMMDGIFVAGDQGFGKSAFAVYMAALCVNCGGRLIVIDPDAEFEQSLTDRLGALAHDLFLLAPIADTPEKAEHALKIAMSEIERPGNYPALLLIDEFSMLMRHAETGTGKWAEVGKAMTSIVEDWATRGRKRRRKPIVLGQITKAKRAGGTEVRDSMTTICFHLKRKRSQTVLDAEEAEITPTLGMGEVLVIPARAGADSYRMQLPYADEDGINRIVESVSRRLVRAQSPEKFFVSAESDEQPETDLKDTGNVLEMTPEMALKARSRRVAELLAQGKNQTEIIEILYRVRPGGSVEYARARDEVRSIIGMLAVEEA
jgi:hypothetical protein